jgi:hypothetical protein
MKFYKENYGADADGNRGVASISYMIEESDKEEIVEKIYEEFLSDTDNVFYNPNPKEYTISMYCYLIDDDIDVEIQVLYYRDDLLLKALNDKDLKDNDEEKYFFLKEKKEFYDFLNNKEAKNGK